MKKLLPITLLVTTMFNMDVYAQTYTAGTTFSSYSDIDPDSLMHYTIVPFSNNVASFDMIGNSLPDIEFTSRGSVSSGGSQAFIRVRPLNPDLQIRFGRWDSVYVPGSDSWNVTIVADALDSGDVINTGGAVWDTTVMYLTDQTGFGGGVKNVNDWVGTDMYLAFKYNSSPNVNYGWMRVECPSADSCFVKDFSFTDVPLGYSETIRKKVNVYPNPTSEFLYIQGDSILGWEVSNAMGKIVIREGHSNFLSVTDLNAGVYLLKVIKSDGIEIITFVKN